MLQTQLLNEDPAPMCRRTAEPVRPPALGVLAHRREPLLEAAGREISAVVAQAVEADLEPLSRNDSSSDSSTR